MAKTFQVYVIGGGAAENDEQVTFELGEAGDHCRLTCSYRGKVLESEGADYFEALCLIREQLAQDRLIPFCYGASMNVYPLGSVRSEYKGLVAYKLKEGRQVTVEDAVDIFAEGPDVIPAPVDIQKNYVNNWHASVKVPRGILMTLRDWVFGRRHLRT